MEFKVRALDSVEPKGVQEIEKELLDKHEQQITGQGDTEGIDEDDSKVQTSAPPELTEEQVLSYIGNRYNKQVNSFDELMAERKESESLPEDVATYLKYKKDTGRGFEDFLKLSKDYDSMDSDKLLREYLSSTQNGLDPEDIDVLMEEYSFDEDVDDESRIKRVKISRKRAIAEAKSYLNEQKEKYKLPLESRGNSMSPEESEGLEAYRQYTQQAKTLQEENNRKRQWFDQKSEEVFSKDFKGFEFNIDEKKVIFSPGTAAELKKSQSTPSNFISKFLDESGLIKDAVGYHKALSIAMNPEKFAKFFYEQGQASATEDVLRKTKNINMSERKTPEVVSKGGMQVKSVTPDSGRSLKIRSIKKL